MSPTTREYDFARKESAETLKAEQQHMSEAGKSYRAKDSGLVAFNDDDRFKLQEIEKAIDCLLAN